MVAADLRAPDLESAAMIGLQAASSAGCQRSGQDGGASAAPTRSTDWWHPHFLVRECFSRGTRIGLLVGVPGDEIFTRNVEELPEGGQRDRVVWQPLDVKTIAAQVAGDAGYYLMVASAREVYYLKLRGSPGPSGSVTQAAPSST